LKPGLGQRSRQNPKHEPMRYKYDDSIWVKINDLACTTAAEDEAIAADELEAFPNPARQEITLSSAAGLRSVVILMEQVVASAVCHCGTTRRVSPWWGCHGEYFTYV